MQKSAYAWLMVILLLAAYTLAFVDRYILTLLIEPMRRDLGLSDTQISLLHGFAFAILYSVAGLPMGRLVDRANRVRIAAWGIAAWSAMTAVCGLAQNYWQLFLARVGVGVGEATLSPAAYSLITDSFRGPRLGLALGIYNLGATIGAALAMMIGGAVVHALSGMPDVRLPLVGHVRAWQLAFLYVGPPGLILSLIVAMLREPPRTAPAGSTIAPLPLAETLRFFRRNARAVGLHHLAMSLASLAIFGAVSWLPVLLIRVHGITIAAAGYAVGTALLVGGLAGSLGGGWLSDRLKQRGDTASRMRVGVVATLIGIPAAALFPLVDHPWLSVGLFAIVYFSAAAPLSAAVATLNEIAPNPLRGQLAAVFIFVTNILALGCGATVVALLSDHVFVGREGVRYSLAVVTPIAFALSALCFKLSIASLRRMLSRTA